MIIDLHTHGYYSPDSELSIPDLLQRYSKGDIVALTDHETIAGWDLFKEEALRRGIRPILGAEWFINGCHILSYFVSDIPNNFINFMAERRSKESSAMHLLYDRAKARFPALPSYENILASKHHPENILGMAALAQQISRISGMGFKEAVELLRGMKKELRFPDERPSPFYASELIKKINEWNGISVLAHPFKDSQNKLVHKTKKDVEEKVHELADQGINGIELFSEGCTNEECSEDELNFLLALAEKQKLKVSMGSDYHVNHNKEKGVDIKALETLGESVKGRVMKWLN